MGESGTPETPIGVENTGVRGSSVDKALITALLNWRPILSFFKNSGWRGSSVDKALLTALINWRPILSIPWLVK